MSYQAHETAVIDAGCEIGEGTHIWHFSHIMTGCVIGRACNIGQNVVVSPGVILGNNVKVQNNVSIYTGVICEDDVFLGPSCVFTNVINPRSAISRKDQYKETVIGKGASIGDILRGAMPEISGAGASCGTGLSGTGRRARSGRYCPCPIFSCPGGTMWRTTWRPSAQIGRASCRERV